MLYEVWGGGGGGWEAAECRKFGEEEGELRTAAK